MKILIVEDEELLSESLCELLAAHGFETEAVYDGETGLEYGLLAVYDTVLALFPLSAAALPAR